jgi:drug/metabolite transporter (DMT)-like permease
MDKSYHRIYVLLSLSALLWGAQPVVIKVVLKEMSPVMITFYRYISISAILLAVLFIQNGYRFILPRARHIFILTAMGLCGITLNNIFQFSGLNDSTVINCTLVSATTPAITAVLAAVFLKEKMNVYQWLGIVGSFCGVLFLVAHGSLTVMRNLSFNSGDLLFFASQCSWAVYSILGRKVMAELSPIATTAWAGLAGAIMAGVYALYTGTGLTVNITASGLWAISYTIIGGGVLAMTWWNQAVQVVGPGQAAIFTNIMPVVGMICAVVFLGEHMGWREIVGGLWIISSVYLATAKKGAASQRVSKKMAHQV